MKEYKRASYYELKKRLIEKRKFIQVITGPRQIGKTTLIKQLLAKIKVPSTYISADSSDGNGRTWIEKHWEAARIISRQKAGEHVLAIDEIQKIPQWSTIIKALWDEDSFSKTEIKLILSGSSGLLLHKGLSESLTGRFEMTRLGHWSLNEMNEAFDWSPEQYAWFGGYPVSAELIADEKRWKQYICDSLVETTISKDILMLTRIDKPALMKQLFDLGCAYSGQIFSYNKMLGQLHDAGNTVTLAHYLRLLDTAGLITGIEKFSGSISRQKSSSPKLMVQNTALVSSRMTETLNDAIRKPEIWGRVVESAAGTHLLNYSAGGKYSIWYWRDVNDEVDFIIQKGRSITALEIKSGNKQKRSGLEKFKNKYKSARIILIGEGGLSWKEFLTINPEELIG